jgi:hypothetical protein
VKEEVMSQTITPYRGFKRKLWITLGSVLFVSVICVLSVVSVTGRANAVDRCRDYVSHNLQSAVPVRFSGGLSNRVKWLGPGKYEVASHVDYLNESGDTVRENWRCVVLKTGSNYTALEYLEFLDR